MNLVVLRSTLLSLVLILVACGTPSRPVEPPRAQTLEGIGLDGAYYGNLEFAGLRMGQMDTQINFDWGTVAPVLGMPKGVFSARWTGSITPQFSESYIFLLEASGEAKLWIDDHLVVDAGQTSGTVELSNARRYAIRLEFRKTQPQASLKLSWESKSQKRTVVVQKHLSPDKLSAQQVSAMAVPAGQNLLLNPDFEGGSGAWLSFGNGIYQTAGPGHSGAGQAATVSNWGWVQQNLPYSSIEGGVSYTLEGWGRSVAGRACTLGLAGGNAAGETFQQPLVFEGAWENKTVARVVPAGTIWLAVYTGSSQGECQFDDLNLHITDHNSPPVPLPSNSSALNNGTFNTDLTSWDIFPSGQGQLLAGFIGNSLSINNWTWVQQDVAVGKLSLGQNYRLRGVVKANAGATCTLGVVGADSSSILFSRTLSFDQPLWQEQNLIQLIPSSTAWVAVYLTTTTQNCWFDDIALEPQSAASTELSNPANFAATSSGNSLTLSWDAVGTASSYILERRTATTSYAPVATLAVTSYTDSVGSSPDTFYSYRLKAVRGNVSSSGSELRYTTSPVGINGGAQAGSQGYFGPLFDWPVIPIHAALLPDGRVFSYGTNTAGKQGASLYYAVWNPTLGTDVNAHTVLANTTKTDIFCSSQTLMANGSVLVVGGDVVQNGSTTNTGNPDINLFNPLDNSLTKSPLQMLSGRWYSSATQLANGDVLISGGKDASGQSTQIPEIYTGQGWRTLETASSAFSSYIAYPRAWQAPNGKVFIAGPKPQMWYLDVAGTGTLTRLANRDLATRTGGVSVMYNVGKVFVAGGGTATNLADAMTIDINGNIPVVMPTSNMITGRYEANATLLPNGRILLTGGTNNLDRTQIADAVYAADTWNPADGKWTRGASATKIRVYHSISLLLPDGRVLTGGGGAPGPQTNLNAEIYYPEYLFKKDGSGSLASRPQILEAPQTLRFAERFTVRTPNAPDIASVSFIALGSVTHGWDMNQRFLPLTINSRGNDTLELGAPASGNLAPPGYYMLFINDSNGVPSVAKIVKIGQ